VLQCVPCMRGLYKFRFVASRTACGGGDAARTRNQRRNGSGHLQTTGNSAAIRPPGLGGARYAKRGNVPSVPMFAMFVSLCLCPYVCPMFPHVSLGFRCGVLDLRDLRCPLPKLL
jgi:hypothetical protein